ncbi:hypothetical protein [Micromonospora sp. RV43]|uniref:hypothetical protein n=1 Tax=Micromonospora sp. RV43 TaxID=1661387 RepID=UPI00064B8E51|nr:hypothetical protein [Micromonospora sp. RV43]
MTDFQREQELLLAAARDYAAAGERIQRARAAAEQTRRAARTTAVQRARANGLTSAQIRAITGWSSETVRQALNPAAYDQATRARTQRRKASRVHHPTGDDQ